MTSPSATFTQFSTDDLPERDRVVFWRDGFARVALSATFDPIVGHPFRQAGAFCALDNLGISFGETSGLLAWRDKRQLADSNDDLMLNVMQSGLSVSSQMRRELQVGPGEAVLLTCGEILSHHIPGPSRGLTLRIPRRVLGNLVADPEGAVMRLVPAGTRALRLLIDYLGLVGKTHDLSSPQLKQAFERHVHDLVAVTLGATRDAAEAARSGGLRAARLTAIRTDIVDHIAEALSVTEIARRHRVTPRYVQMLFEAEGGTFTEFVLEQRLMLAHRRLIDSRFASQTISAIAFGVGFANLSYFNRVFRRRYGAAPSEVREAALRARDC